MSPRLTIVTFFPSYLEETELSRLADRFHELQRESQRLARTLDAMQETHNAASAAQVSGNQSEAKCEILSGFDLPAVDRATA
jgi:hypothetical protein